MVDPTPTDRDLRLRRAARALIIDRAEQVLLVCFSTGHGKFWITPGGGLEPGETMHAGLRRELVEELGQHNLSIGPHVWTRTTIFPVGAGYDGQYNETYLIRSEHFWPEPQIGWDGMRAEGVCEMRWFALDEIEQLELEPRLEEKFLPRRFVQLTRQILADGPPPLPVVVDD